MTTTLIPGSIDPLVADAVTEDPAAPHPRIKERQVAVQLANLKQRNNRVAAIGALVALVMLAWAMLQSPLFDVDEVRVVGAQTLEPGSVAALSEVSTGDPIFGLDLAMIEDRLEIVPSIASATATKSWGGTVDIEIVERVPSVQFRNGETWLLTAADGMVISHLDSPKPGVPGVRGALFQTAPGRRVPAEVTVSLAVAAAMPTDVAGVVETITQTADSLILDLYGGATIELGDSRNLSEKFAAARAFLAQVELRCVDTIKVQAPTVPVVVRAAGC